MIPQDDIGATVAACHHPYGGLEYRGQQAIDREGHSVALFNCKTCGSSICVLGCESCKATGERYHLTKPKVTTCHHCNGVGAERCRSCGRVGAVLLDWQRWPMCEACANDLDPEAAEAHRARYTVRVVA